MDHPEMGGQQERTEDLLARYRHMKAAWTKTGPEWKSYGLTSPVMLPTVSGASEESMIMVAQ